MADDHLLTSVTRVSICSDNGLSPGRHQAIIWTNAGILLIGPLGTNFSEMLSEIQTFPLRKKNFNLNSVHFASGLGLNVLKNPFRMIFKEWLIEK